MHFFYPKSNLFECLFLEYFSNLSIWRGYDTIKVKNKVSQIMFYIEKIEFLKVRPSIRTAAKTATTFIIFSSITLKDYRYL